MPLIGKWPALEGEFERLRGGFGGAFGWIALVHAFALGLPAACLSLLTIFAGEAPMGLCCGSFALVMALFGAWPVLRSSRYILTNRRLLVTSRFGSTNAIPLARIERGSITVDPLTSSLTLGGERPISLRYIGKCRRLWSLLLLPLPDEAIEAEILSDGTSPFRTIVAADQPSETDSVCRDKAEAQPAPALHEPVDFVWWNAQRIDGLRTQKGIAILRASYFVFLPATDAKNLALMTAGAFAGAFAEHLGIHHIHIEGKVPFEALLDHLKSCDGATFDAEIAMLTKEFDAPMWQHGELVVPRETRFVPFQGRNVVYLANRTTVVSGGLQSEQVSTYRRLASLWPEVPDLKYRSTASTVFLAVLLVFFSIFSGCAIYFAIKEPVPVGTVATALITLLTLVGWIGWIRSVLPKRRATSAETPSKDLRKVNAPRFDK